MQSLHGTTWPRHFAFWALATLHLKSTVRAECAPTTWDNSEFETTGHCSVPNPLAATSAAVPIPVPTSHLISTGYVTPGEVNCRYDTNTEDMEINEHTCTAIAVRYGITLKAFFVLNPGLHSDCGNIEANTDYCVAGFIEPLRAYDGLCGPSNNNATCLGIRMGQCCNANTWKCGNSSEDCADGTCYEGACAGDSVYTTDGNCGRKHGYKSCAGVWGNCCNATGRCGSGPDFCGYGKCQLGECWLNGICSKISFFHHQSKDDLAVCVP